MPLPKPLPPGAVVSVKNQLRIGLRHPHFKEIRKAFPSFYLIDRTLLRRFHNHDVWYFITEHARLGTACEYLLSFAEFIKQNHKEGILLLDGVCFSDPDVSLLLHLAYMLPH